MLLVICRSDSKGAVAGPRKALSDGVEAVFPSELAGARRLVTGPLPHPRVPWEDRAWRSAGHQEPALGPVVIGCQPSRMFVLRQECPGIRRSVCDLLVQTSLPHGYERVPCSTRLT